MRKGVILLIEDDHDDKDLLVEIMQELNVKNKIVWFDNCEDAYNFISETRESIYIIFSDINLPKKTGL